MWLLDDLPLHPLVVHLPVVIIPLVAAGLFVYLVAPAWRRPLGLALAALALAGFAGAVIGAWSGVQLGDALRRGDELNAHQAAGERARTYAALLAVATIGLVLVERRPERSDRVVASAAATAAVLAVGASAAIALTGHTGAQLAWADKVAAATSAPTPDQAASIAGVVATPAGTPADPSGSAAGAEPPGESGEPVVDVVLGEWALVASASVAPPGNTTFRFRNMGTVTHALRIRTQGSGKNRLEWRSARVAPGGEGLLTVDLTSGSYDVDCPIEDAHGEHDAMGMETTFAVRADAPPITAAPVSSPPAGVPAASGPAATAKVEISGFAFAPPILRVRSGTTITWVNRDPAPHTATGNAWDTGRLGTGAAATHTFPTVGTFRYVCAIHPAMTGTVQVT